MVLVGMMMLTVAWSIQAADYAPGLQILTPVVVGGVLMGALLGTAVWLPAGLAHGWSMVLGAAWTALLGTSAIARYAGREALAGQDLLQRLALVRDWYLAWLTAARSGAQMGEGVVQFAFVITMAVLLWLLAYICTWFVVRYVSWWGAVLPSGFALLFNLHQAPDEDMTALAFFLLCALLLAEQTHVTLQVDRWQRERISFGPGISLDLLRDGLVIALVVIGIAWLAPEQVTVRGLRGLASNVSDRPRHLEQRLSELFPGPTILGRGSGLAFGDSMPLGGSVSLGGQAIFEAHVEGAPAPPRTWRMAVFDRYDGGAWHRTVAAEVPGDEVGPAWATAPASSVVVTQTVRVFQSGATQLYALPQPAGFGLPVTVQLGTGPAPESVLAVFSASPLGVGDTYAARSAVSVADEASLRAASAADPAWLRPTYTALPGSLPPRVVHIAEQVTAGAANRYDAAQSIEAFLRGYAYSEEINTPPEGRDRVDWFLFDERRGYCDYFSSAFVVMARSVGVPARLAAGYSAGTFVAETSSYRQHEHDAHTWPEVFFPGHGWIEFEPTAADAAIERPGPAADGESQAPVATVASPADADASEPEAASRLPAPAATLGPQSGAARTWLRLLALAGVMAFAAAATAYWAWQRPLRGLGVAEGAFARLTRLATWLGHGPRPSDTPDEYGVRLARVVPQRSADIDAIVDAYVHERFGRQAVVERARALRDAWARLRRTMILAVRRPGGHRAGPE